MKKGISLILLVITIIIIIILSGSIILTILPNNVISDSKATVQKADFKTISDEFNLYKSNLYTKTDGKFDMTTINADSTNIGTICKTAEKYKDIFKIVNGNLEYTGNNTAEKTLAKEYSMIYYGTEKTGTNISINNSLEATIPSLTIYGKSIQNTKVQGANKAELTNLSLYGNPSQNVLDSGYVVITRLDTNNYLDFTPKMSDYVKHLIDTTKTYKIIIEVVENTFTNANVDFGTGYTPFNSGSTSFSPGQIGVKSFNSTIRSNFDASNNYAYFWLNNTKTNSVVGQKIKFRYSIYELGSEPSPYVYNSFIANSPTPEYPSQISSVNNFNILSSGKNILNFKSGDLVNCTAEYLDNGVILKSTSTTGYLRVPILLAKGKNYKMSFNSTRTGSTGGGYYSTTSSGQLITGSANSLNAGYGDIASSSTTNYDIVYIRLYANNGGNVGDSATFTNIQLEQNSVATEYTKYIPILSSNITSILRAIKVENNSSIYTYQDDSNNRYMADYIEMKDNKVNLVRNIGLYTFTGSETFYTGENYQSISRIYSLLSGNKIGQSNTNNNLLSDKFTCKTWNAKYVPLSNNVHTYSGDSRVGICMYNSLVGILSGDDNQTRITKIKTWISNNNFIIQYILNTPVITDITNTPEGQALLNIKTQKGYTNVYDTSGLDLWKKIVVKEM